MIINILAVGNVKEGYYREGRTYYPILEAGIMLSLYA